MSSVSIRNAHIKSKGKVKVEKRPIYQKMFFLIHLHICINKNEKTGSQKIVT